MKEMLTLATPGVKSIDRERLEGKVLVLSSKALGARYQAPQFQLFKATGGFGCNPGALGRAVMGTFLSDGEHSRFDRFDFIGWVEQDTADKIMQVKAEPAPFDPTQMGYLLATGEGTWVTAPTLAEALKKCGKKGFNPKTMGLWRCHVESWINELGGVHFPEGTEWMKIE